MKLTKNKIAFLNARQDEFTFLMGLMTSSGEPPQKLENYNMENVLHIVNASPFFKKLGGKENMTVTNQSNGDHCVIVINVVSVSPDRKQYSTRVLYVTCNADTHYDFLNA